MRVRYTLTAAAQIDAALDYLAARSPSAARGLRMRIQDVVALLQAYPHSARTTSKRSIRRFPLGSYPYLLDYSVTDDEIVVRRFRHSARRPIP